MPCSGARSKTSRGKSRKAASAPDDPTPSAPANSFEALAPLDQGEPVKPDEEEPDGEEQEEEAAGAAGSLGAAAETTSTTTSAPPGGSVGEGSSLAEDLLTASSILPAHGPVRVETDGRLFAPVHAGRRHAASRR